MNGIARASSSTTELRQHYAAATRAFLVRDYAGTAASLHDALALVSSVPQRAWFDAVQAGTPVPLQTTLRRRLDVLQITFLATVRSTPGSLAPAPALQPLLDRPPAHLIKALWHALLRPPAGTPADKVADDDAGAEADILPARAAAHLHPALAVALALAALKLDEPRLARAVAEAWFASVDDDVEAVVWDAAGAADWSDGELALDAVGGAGMTASFVGGAGKGAPPQQQPDAHRQLLAAWLRLVDLLVLHILPKLGEWDAAGDFVRMQGAENGGWVPDERVEAALRRLTELQQEEAHLIAARAQRQADLAAARVAASQRRSPSSSRSDKGKSRARDGSPTDSAGGGSGSASSGGSPNGKSKSRRRAVAAAATAGAASPRASPSLGSDATTGFAGLRDSLGAYLTPRADGSSSPSTTRAVAGSGPPARAQQRGPLRALAASLHALYAADPVRVISVVCFACALVTWARRRVRLRRARGDRGLGIADAVALVGARVVETVRMMTKVTAM
ncbi:hypothetical protein JCM3770_006100 [Rhodotorula araucariae]